MSFLIGDKVILRPVRKSDLIGAYAEWINDQETDAFTEHAQFPHSYEDLERYYEDKSKTPVVWLAILEKTSSKHVGNIELSDIDWVHRKGHYSIIVGDNKSRGKGYGYEASQLVLQHAFNKLNLNRIELGVHEDNSAAIKLYNKLGFVVEGRLRKALLRNGRYRDILIMSLLSDEFLNKQKEVKRSSLQPKSIKRG